ncbi:hypothetical protein MTO96_036107 [Rhipicephalus appendiculatus]
MSMGGGSGISYGSTGFSILLASFARAASLICFSLGNCDSGSVLDSLSSLLLLFSSCFVSGDCILVPRLDCRSESCFAPGESAFSVLLLFLGCRSPSRFVSGDSGLSALAALLDCLSVSCLVSGDSAFSVSACFLDCRSACRLLFSRTGFASASSFSATLSFSRSFLPFLGEACTSGVSVDLWAASSDSNAESCLPFSASFSRCCFRTFFHILLLFTVLSGSLRYAVNNVFFFQALRSLFLLRLCLWLALRLWF